MGRPGRNFPFWGIPPVPAAMPFHRAFPSERAGSFYPGLPGPQWSVDAASERETRQVSSPVQTARRAEQGGRGLTWPPPHFRSPPPGSAADLSEAEPTLTHMSIARLHEQNLVRAPCGRLLYSPRPRVGPAAPPWRPRGSRVPPVLASGPPVMSARQAV